MYRRGAAPYHEGVLAAALSVPAAYLLGTFPTAAVVSRRTGHDPTREGSGNPGATNVYRTAGRRAGAMVLVGDVLKGAAAAGLGRLAGDHTLAVVCGAAAVAGHVLPVTRRSRGGKGVATYGGAVLATFPLVGVGAAGVWAAVTAATRRPSVASLVVAGGVPLALGALGTPGREVAVVALAAAVVVVRHRDNIVRLAHGEERAIEVGGPC